MTHSPGEVMLYIIKLLPMIEGRILEPPRMDTFGTHLCVEVVHQRSEKKSSVLELKGHYIILFSCSNFYMAHHSLCQDQHATVNTLQLWHLHFHSFLKDLLKVHIVR